MHTICMLSLKGGAGKSTVVQSLAVCAVQHGQKTLIVELDPQGSLKNWSKRRQAFEPRVHQTLPQSLGDVLDEARHERTNWVFIDTPGHDTSTAAAAAAHADLILIPCKIQSMKDFDSVMLTLAEANRVQKPAYVLMNQVPPNSPKLIRQKQVEIQQEYEIAVLSKCLSRRADFEYCDAKGMSAAEYNPNGAAAQETKRLYALIQSIFITLKPNRGQPTDSAGFGLPEQLTSWPPTSTVLPSARVVPPAMTSPNPSVPPADATIVATEAADPSETVEDPAAEQALAVPHSAELPEAEQDLADIEDTYDVSRMLRSNKWGS